MMSTRCGSDMTSGHFAGSLWRGSNELWGSDDEVSMAGFFAPIDVHGTDGRFSSTDSHKTFSDSAVDAAAAETKLKVSLIGTAGKVALSVSVSALLTEKNCVNLVSFLTDS